MKSLNSVLFALKDELFSNKEIQNAFSYGIIYRVKNGRKKSNIFNSLSRFYSFLYKNEIEFNNNSEDMIAVKFAVPMKMTVEDKGLNTKATGIGIAFAVHYALYEVTLKGETEKLWQKEIIMEKLYNGELEEAGAGYLMYVDDARLDEFTFKIERATEKDINIKNAASFLKNLGF